VVDYSIINFILINELSENYIIVILLKQRVIHKTPMNLMLKSCVLVLEISFFLGFPLLHWSTIQRFHALFLKFFSMNKLKH